MLLTMVILLNAILSVTAATLAFGAQTSLGVLPAVVVSQIFSSIVFYSVAFMSGELVRRSSLSYVLASAVYFTSEIAGIYLRSDLRADRNTFYQHLNFYLPTTPGSSLSVLIAQPGLQPPALAVLQFVNIGATETSITFSVVPHPGLWAAARSSSPGCTSAGPTSPSGSRESAIDLNNVRSSERPENHMKWSSQRVIVTGGAGFIGSNMVDTLLDPRSRGRRRRQAAAGERFTLLEPETD